MNATYIVTRKIMKQEVYDHEVYGDLNWMDAPSNVKMAVYIKNRIIPVGEDLTCQVILWNQGAAPISTNMYIDTNCAGNLDSCIKDKMDNILPGNIAYEMWTIKTQGRQVGDHEVGFYCEPRDGSYYGKKAGRAAMGFIVGIKPGNKVGGFSTKYRIVSGIDCPQCNGPLQWRRADPRTGWYCRNCDGWL